MNGTAHSRIWKNNLLLFLNQELIKGTTEHCPRKLSQGMSPSPPAPADPADQPQRR
jgi:hypothetical protein